MTRSRSICSSLMAIASTLVFAGCVEQEPDRPTEQDKQIIAKNILKTVPAMKYKVNADLEGKVTYLGLDVDQDKLRPGQQFTLTHYWKVNKRVDGWRIFVHLNGPQKRGFINADHTPIGGRYPASKWKPGEIIRDEHKVTLPADYKESKVQVLTGLWKGKLRMKIKGPQDKENRVLAATLDVVGAKPAAPVKPKRLLAFKSDKPIKVDGVLDEPVWAKTPSTGAFVGTLKGEALDWKTEAKVAWDDKNLYVGFTAQDDDVWSELKKRDDKLWTQEAVELFIDANGDGKDYIELQVNPQGAIFDSYLPAYRKNENDWNSKMQVAVKVDGTLNKREDKDKGWTVELAIPWSDVYGKSKEELTPVAPVLGAIFKVNFFRMDLPKGKPQRASAWSAPMVGDFHKLDRFGELVFADAEGKFPAGTKAAAPVKRVDPAVAQPGRVVNMTKMQKPVRGRLIPQRVNPRAKTAPKAGK